MSDVNIAGSPQNLFAQQVTVPNGATGVSEFIALQGMALCGIFMPATWVAAAIGYQVSYDGKNFFVVESAGTPVTSVVTQGRYIPFPTPDALFVPFLKIASVTAGTATAVNQTADRTVVLLFRKLFS